MMLKTLFDILTLASRTDHDIYKHFKNLCSRRMVYAGENLLTVKKNMPGNRFLESSMLEFLTSNIDISRGQGKTPKLMNHLVRSIKCFQLVEY